MKRKTPNGNLETMVDSVLFCYTIKLSTLRNYSTFFDEKDLIMSFIAVMLGEKGVAALLVCLLACLFVWLASVTIILLVFSTVV